MEASFYQNLTASIFYRCFHAMKAFLLLLFISLLSLHNSVEHSEICGNFANPDSYLCRESLLPEGYYKCCFEVYSISRTSFSSCLPITKEQFNDLSNFIKYRESLLPVHRHKDYYLTCPSKASGYLAPSILSFILLLL